MNNKHRVFLPDEEDCNCHLPEQSCKICRAIARKIYGSDYYLFDDDENSNEGLISDLDECDRLDE